MTSQEKIAKIIGCSTELIINLEKKMEEATGKKAVMDKIMEENRQKMDKIFRTLGISENAKATEIFDALVSKIESDDHEFTRSIGAFSFSSSKDCDRLGKLLEGASARPVGFFLKLEKAKEFLIKEPPPNTMSALGYKNAEDMLEKEDLLEIFSSLRFMEDGNWLNNIFFKQYENLKPDDFEERGIVCRGLNTKWVKLAEKFVKKKYHNISHLKELGFIFIIPIELDVSGEILRNFSLLLHYMHEVKFYSDIFRIFSESEDTFSHNVISALRGDLPEYKEPEADKNRWLIIQRYLAKENLFDKRLFVPHINSETIHWDKAENDLARIALKASNNIPYMDFWKDLNWVGDYFPNGRIGPGARSLGRTPSNSADGGIEELIGFNLVDIAMSLVKEKEMIKYLYHQREALWNKIFIEYMGKNNLEKIVKENWLKGYIEL